MISCDSNILICAYATRLEHHERALSFLNSQIDNNAFALSELVLMELYGLLCNPHVIGRPLTPEGAVEIVQELRSNSRWTILKATIDVSESIWRIASTAQFSRRAVYDARIAYSLAAEGVTRFATNNIKDFDRFGVLELFDPLA